LPQVSIDAQKEEGKTSHWPSAPTWYTRWGFPAAICHRGRILNPLVQTQIQVAINGVVPHYIPKNEEIVSVSLQQKHSWLQSFRIREVLLSYY
jgi:hypothetical protein